MKTNKLYEFKYTRYYRVYWFTFWVDNELAAFGLHVYIYLNHVDQYIAATYQVRKFYMHVKTYTLGFPSSICASKYVTNHLHVTSIKWFHFLFLLYITHKNVWQIMLRRFTYQPDDRWSLFLKTYNLHLLWCY